MMIEEDVRSDLAIPPGEYLEEVLFELGMTKDELARRMSRPATKFSAVYTGDKAITSETALQLEKVVGVPAHIWSELESEYRLTLARNQQARDAEKLRDERGLVAKFCYSELVKLGYAARQSKAVEKVRELQSFFGVTSLKNIPTLKRYQAAFRQGKGRRSPEATAAWLRIGELAGQKATLPPFNKKGLQKALLDIRKLTRLSPEEFEPRLHEILSGVGVEFVLCPHLPKTYLHGAVFWLGKNKAVLMLTIRGSWADVFWFSLFHEIGHLLLHNKQTVFLEGDRQDQEFETAEHEADRFAADTLISSDAYKSFVDTKAFYPQDIKTFASRLEIDPGIVVGRLQHDRCIKNAWHNDLRKRYKWK